MTELDLAFRRRAMHLISEHPELRCEWCTVNGILSGDRTDLICKLPDGRDVFASLNGHQITVGLIPGDAEDFENFGRGKSDDMVAAEALGQFKHILFENLGAQ